jgi:hypothetical protein
MRVLWIITRVALPAIAVASFVGGFKHGYGFSTGN